MLKMCYFNCIIVIPIVVFKIPEFSHSHQSFSLTFLTVCNTILKTYQMSPIAMVAYLPNTLLPLINFLDGYLLLA